MSENVHKLTPKDDLPVKDEPAIGMSIVMNLDEGAQMTLQGFFGASDSEEKANRLADRMVRMAERQKAKHELVKYAEELEGIIKTVQRFEEDFAKTEARHKYEDAQRHIQADELVTAAKQAEKDGYNKHVADGKRGPYKPQGTVLSRIERCRVEVKKLDEDEQKANAERAQWMETIVKSRQRFEEEIASRKARIALCRELLGLGKDPEPDGA